MPKKSGSKRPNFSKADPLRSLTLTPAQLEKFPAHDAQWRGFWTFQDPGTGDLQAALDLGVTDRSYDPGYLWPEKNGVTRLVFRNCRLVRADLKGGSADADRLLGIETLRHSELMTEASSWPSPLSSGALHCRITSNFGSKIDIVAEEIALTFPST